MIWRKNHHKNHVVHKMTTTTTMLLLLLWLLLLLSVNQNKSSVHCLKLWNRGSSFNAPLQRKLTDEFSLHSSLHHLEYDAKNSLDGCHSVLRHVEDDATGSDLSTLDFNPLYYRELVASGLDHGDDDDLSSVFCVPSSVESLVFVANLETDELSHLNMTQDLILSIYNGSVQYWDHEELRRLNPSGAHLLPHRKIIVLYRTEQSGTTFVLSSFFSSISEEWRSAYGASTRIPFENIVGSILPIVDNRMMMSFLSHAGFSFGYTSLSAYETNNEPDPDPLVLIHILDQNGQPQKPDRKSIVNTVANSKWAKESSLYPKKGSTFIPSIDLDTLFNVQCEQCYPIVSFNYWCMQKSQLTMERGVALYEFMRDSYALISDQVKFSAMYPATLVSPPQLLLRAAKKEIDKQLVCGKQKDSCSETYPNLGPRVLVPLIVSLASVAALALFLLVVGSSYFICARLFCGKFLPKPMRGSSKKRSRKDNELKESLIDRNILEELNIDQRTNIDASEFTLDKQIGTGSFSEVFKGRWNGAPVAIKRFLYVDVDAQREILDDFLKETALMSALHHPNIVKFYGAAKQHPHLYIVSEFCERGSLQAILRDKSVPLSNRKLLGMAVDISRGMTYLHGSEPPIIHRDLKTGNLLVDRNWRIKVADFGLSRVADRSRRMTLCGTAETCAPEVLSKGGTYSEKADVYSFGIVLWEMFSRKPLYPDLTFFELSEQVVENDLRPNVSELPPNVPPDIIAIMQQCWQREPEKRPPFSALRKQLEDILAKYQQEREKGKKATDRSEDVFTF